MPVRIRLRAPPFISDSYWNYLTRKKCGRPESCHTDITTRHPVPSRLPSREGGRDRHEADSFPRWARNDRDWQEKRQSARFRRNAEKQRTKTLPTRRCRSRDAPTSRAPAALVRDCVLKSTVRENPIRNAASLSRDPHTIVAIVERSRQDGSTHTTSSAEGGDLRSGTSPKGERP